MKNQTWWAPVRDSYSSLEDLKRYDATFGIAQRCGFGSVEELWDANPVIGGSTNPADFGLAEVGPFKFRWRHTGDLQLSEGAGRIQDWKHCPGA